MAILWAYQFFLSGKNDQISGQVGKLWYRYFTSLHIQRHEIDLILGLFSTQINRNTCKMHYQSNFTVTPVDFQMFPSKMLQHFNNNFSNCVPKPPNKRQTFLRMQSENVQLGGWVGENKPVMTSDAIMTS